MAKTRYKLNFDIKFLTLVVLVLPLAIAVYATIYFENESTKQIEKISQQIGTVAGTEDKEEVISLSTDQLPIIPNSNIVSLDRQNNSINLTLEINRPDEEIKNFYDDYFFQNNWINTEETKYTKDDQQMEINIQDGVIKILITKK